jgi:hypothetical protein
VLPSWLKGSDPNFTINGFWGQPGALATVSIRLWKEGGRDVVMEICCALHNFRVRLTPWQPMV